MAIQSAVARLFASPGSDSGVVGQVSPDDTRCDGHSWVSKVGGARGRVPSSEKFRRGRPPDSRMKWPKSGAFADF